MSKLNIIFYRMSKEQGIVSELSNYFGSSDDHSVEFISTVAEANQYLPVAGSGIFIFEVKTKVDLQAAVNVLKNQKKLIKTGFLKPSCILHINNKKIEKILIKYGCVDLLEPGIKSKSLSFKIDFWSRALTTLLKKQEKELELNSKKDKYKSEINAGAKTKKKEDFVYVAPLKLQSDIWLVKSKTDCKKILRRWLLKILGPSPHAGKWIELKPQPRDKLPTWKYTLVTENDQFIVDDGSWFFYGLKPEFDWKLKRWNFSSDLPHLYFYSKDDQVFSRFKFIDGSIEVAGNSKYAEAKEELILETCDSNFSFESDEPESENSQSLDADNDELAGIMEGDVKDGTEDLDGNLTGKLDTSLNAEEIEKRKDFGLYPEDDLGGQMGGKGSTDEINGGPMSGKLNPGEEVAAKKRKESDSLSEDDLGAHYGGKGSTDEISDGPMSGKLKPGETKEKEDKRNSFKEDASAGHMGGKGSTDELDGSPLSGALKPSEAKEKEDKKNSFKEDAIAGHMGGKTNPADPEQPDDASSDELNRDGLTPFGKNKNNAAADNPAPLGGENQPEVGNSLGQNPDQPFNPPHQLTQEEFDKLPQLEKDALSRDGIGIISKDKDGNPILDESGKPVFQNLMVGNIKDTLAPGSSSSTNQHTDKFGADIKSPFGKKPLPMINGNNELGKEQAEKDANTAEGVAGQSSANKNRLSKKTNLTSEQEASMEEALGGGLAETLNTSSGENKKVDLNEQIGKRQEGEESEVIDLQTKIGKAGQKKEFDLSKIIDGKEKVRTESGELKVILKQETKAGNDITFICDFEDFYTDELVVHAPKDSLPLNSKVKGKVSLKYGDQKINVIIEGTISEVEEFDEKKDTLVIDVNSISKKDYDQFMSLYQDRQENIMDFMQKAKGY